MPQKYEKLSKARKKYPFFLSYVNLFVSLVIKRKQKLKQENMLVAAIIIYIVLAILFGPMWPLDMFGRGGCLGQLIVAGWVALLIAGMAS